MANAEYMNIFWFSVSSIRVPWGLSLAHFLIKILFNQQSPSKECEPYRTANDKPIAPCGAIANSMFNGKTYLLKHWALWTVGPDYRSLYLFFSFPFFPTDTLELYYIDPNGTRTQIPLVKKGIAWWTDKHVKFRNPGGNNSNLTASFQGMLSSFWGHPVTHLFNVEKSLISKTEELTVPTNVFDGKYLVPTPRQR